MGSNSISYSCTALLGTNKKGILKPDDKGYYSITVGGFNIRNHSGINYPLGNAAALFAPGSMLHRQLKAGVVRAEYGHPRREGMNDTDFFRRLNEIHEEKVCGTFRELTLEYNAYKSKDGFPIVGVLGEIRPSGPYGKYLKESLDNPDEETCFSVRAAVVPLNGERYVDDIVTYDYVNEGGIIIARKYYSMGLENVGGNVVQLPLGDDLVVTPRMLDVACKMAEKEAGLESADTHRLFALRERLGWAKPSGRIYVPTYL